ncbi:MAG: DUF3306 domain-containing protein [Pseudomonadota bacterium]
MSRDDGFLNRWSRRKLQQGDDSAAESPPQPELAEDQGHDTLAEARSEGEILEELDLPDPDTLSAGDDFSGFMAKAVPERLRNRALRKLWLTNPVLANLDELVDYGDDFTDAATVIENLQTVYRVGHGMIDKTPPPEAEEQDVTEECDDVLAEDDAARDDPDPTDDTAVEEEAISGPEGHAVEVPSRITQVIASDIDASASAPRRMRFAFDDAERP